MLLTDPLCHSATLPVAAPASRAFAFMADGLKLGVWSFGCWETRALADGVFVGTSMMSGEATYVRIAADAERLQVDYFVGGTADSLTPRIIARVLPADDGCLLSLIAWRGPTASDERWRLTCAAHETEVFRIRYLIESGA